LSERKASFAALADHRTRVLVLGSLPGERSLAARQYYANPTNQFWALMGEVLEEDLAPLPYDLRLARLGQRGVGLWDVFADARRNGSLDASIRDSRENAFVDLARTLPAIKALAFNGGTAARIGRRQLGRDPAYAVIDLPSSSAAYCRINFAAKAQRWKALREFFD
jgi:hypoxanthine-DNA glycosylase